MAVRERERGPYADTGTRYQMNSENMPPIFSNCMYVNKFSIKHLGRGNKITMKISPSTSL